MFGRLLSVSLCLAFLTGCGVPATSSRTATASPHATAADYSGTYLALCFEPSQEVADTASRLRQQLGFLDLTHAVPPRKGDELHLTVGYFRKLMPHQADQIAQTFRRKDTYLYIDGYGVANKQVAYFTVQGCEEARATLKGFGIQFDSDDPHVTFGVHPGNPRDVHGVPKKAQQSLSPYKLLASFHLKQGSKNIW